MQDADVVAKVRSLDLGPILYTLIEKPDGPRWSPARAKTAEKWYRRFLFLVAKYPNEVIVPTKEVDEIWHAHILDTRKYEQDCEHIFGGYLHHFPYLGIRNADDREAWLTAFLRTLGLLELHFNETPVDNGVPSLSAICGGSCASTCSDSSTKISGNIDLDSRPTIFV